MDEGIAMDVGGGWGNKECSRFLLQILRCSSRGDLIGGATFEVGGISNGFFKMSPSHGLAPTISKKDNNRFKNNFISSILLCISMRAFKAGFAC